ncbi:MAG TPA: glycosyltransferase, partial [Acidimicrobiales bacterium]
MTSFVQGDHDYLVPVVPGRGPDGRGRAQTYRWPTNAREITPSDLAIAAVDLVVLQRPRDVELCDEWLGGRRVGHDLPAVWVEHNAPQGNVEEMRHPAVALGGDVRVVHVTAANALLWDTGDVPTHVIEHGIIDPGPRYTGDVPRAAVVVNEPVRRTRVAGIDLLGAFARVADLDAFGMDTEPLEEIVPGLRAFGDVPHDVLLDLVARRRVYLHPYRWTSLGLALIEAMMLAMPVVVVASLEAATSIPREAGVVSNRVDELIEGLDHLLRDRREAA